MSSDTRLTVTYEYVNCTSTARFTQADYNYLVIFTANEGYHFIIGDTENYLLYENGDKWYPADSAYVTNDGIVNQLKMTTKMLDYPTTATMHVQAYIIEDDTVAIDLIQNLAFCTSNISDSSVTPSTTITIVLRADTGYVFESLPTYIINSAEHIFIRSATNACYAEFTTPSTGTIVINASAISAGYDVSFFLVNCTVTPNITRIDYSTNITYTLKANSGYKFENANPPYYWAGGISDSYSLTKVDDYTYTLDTDNVYSKRTLEIFGTALQDISQPATDINISYGFITIYLPTMQALFELSKKRFYNSDMNRVDMFQYMYKIHKMYFNIPPETETTIALAFYRTKITSLATSNAFIDADCGDVFVSELYHNIFDYQFTTSRIYLPMIGYQEIDTTYIMNSTVHLAYKANIVTGSILAELSTAERGNLYQFEGYGGFDIPYMTNEFTNGVNHDLYQSSAYLGSFIPSIQLITNIPYGDNGDNPFGYGVSKWTKIGDCTGYIKCQDIQLVLSQSFITNSELTMIKNLLANGVFI